MRVAVLVDGDFFLRRYRSYFKLDSLPAPEIMADELRLHCNKHVKSKYGEVLHRIYFYDCPPLTKRVHNPVSNRCVTLGKTPKAQFRTSFHNAVRAVPATALRLGYLDENNAQWKIRDPKKQKKLISGESVELLEEDLVYHASQKGVDMKIGLDIATLTLKNHVEKIVLIAGDSDFVPASKLARVEGVTFTLDAMHQTIKKDLSEHIDYLRTALPKDKEMYLEGKDWYSAS